MARVMVLGRSGSGKSWFAGKILADILEGDADFDGENPPDEAEAAVNDATSEDSRGFEYAAHLDLEDEERGLSQADDPLLLTFEVDSETLASVVSYKTERDAPDYIPERELEGDGPFHLPLVKWVLYRNRYVRFVPEGLSKDEMVLLVEFIADAAMQAGSTHFSLDEAHLVAQKHNIGDKLMRLATGGRKRGVEWLFITQRPQKIHEDILSQTDYTIYFNLRDRDLEKAADKAEAIPDAEGEIGALGKREAIIEDFDAGTYEQFSTDGMERAYPHAAGDDGVANPHWESLLGDGAGDEAGS